MIENRGKGELVIGKNVTFGKDVAIDVSERLEIGDRSIIGNYFEISGRWIKIGREFWSGKHCTIGGGSCFNRPSKLTIGYWGHLGDNAFINTAREVKIGNEVGLGQDTKIYTHGAYQSFLKDFPVEFGPITIEDNVWCPSAMIMPNVTIGHDTVVGAGAVVTKNIPSGCLAVGMPAKVIKENCYPKPLSYGEFQVKMIDFISHFAIDIMGYESYEINTKITVVSHSQQKILWFDKAVFDFETMQVLGKATELSEVFKNELRRYGVRFKSYAEGGEYKQWI